MPAVVHVHTRSFYGNFWAYKEALNLHGNLEFKQKPEVYGNPRVLQGNPEFARKPKFTRKFGGFTDILVIFCYLSRLDRNFYRVGFINPGLSVPASPDLVCSPRKVCSAIPVLYKLPVDQAPGFDEASV